MRANGRIGPLAIAAADQCPDIVRKGRIETGQDNRTPVEPGDNFHHLHGRRDRSG
jgi:hypothetical protein